MAHVWYATHNHHLVCSHSNILRTTSRRTNSSRNAFLSTRARTATTSSSPPPDSNGAPPSPLNEKKKGPFILEIPLDEIRRPLSMTRANDPRKVKDLMLSISEIGLQEPIDVLEVDGVYYGMNPSTNGLGLERLAKAVGLADVMVSLAAIVLRHTSVWASQLSVVKLEGVQKPLLGIIYANKFKLAQ